MTFGFFSNCSFSFLKFIQVKLVSELVAYGVLFRVNGWVLGVGVHYGDLHTYIGISWRGYVQCIIKDCTFY